jgi:hypothetical protein
VKIYVASSWRNSRQPEIVKTLRAAGHDVYDFRNPEEGDHGFHWSDIDTEWKTWGAEAFAEKIDHPIAKAGYAKDADAMLWADAFVLVMPCGRSAHLEAGWAVGVGKPLAILLADGEPELMYRMASTLVVTLDDLVSWAATALDADTKRPLP